MWAETKVAELPAAPALLSDRDLMQVSRGFLTLFWGLGATAMAVVETLVAPAVRALPLLVLGGGLIALVSGAWRLRRVRGLGVSWQRRTRDLLVTAVLTAYLGLFYVLWRQLPLQPYLLGHAVAFGAGLLALLCLLCLPVAVFARATGRAAVATQAVVSGTMAVVVLTPPFGLVTQALALALRQGRDPVAVIHFWLERMPWWLPVTGLLPVAMTASLLWSAKDLAWDLWARRQAEAAE